MIKPIISCFIIMPFSGTSETRTQKYWDYHFEFFLKTYIEEIGSRFGATINVSRSTPIRGNVSNKIIYDLIQSDIVIADLTDFNRNVMWEVGVRQSFRNATILIGEEGTEKKIPFDISKIAMLTYCINHNPKNPEFAIFLEKLEFAIKDCIENPYRVDSPVLEAMSGRSTFYEIIVKNENLRKIEGLISECAYNTQTMEICLTIIDKHKKDKQNKVVVADRIQTNSFALLMTNRYLEENSHFYESVETIFRELVSTDKVLEAWTHKLEDGDSFLERNIPNLVKKISEFEGNLKIIHENLRKEI